MVTFDKSMFKSKSFTVVDGTLRLKVTPEEGWYVVQGLDDDGIVTQGRSIEEAIYMAHDAAKGLAESRAIIAAQEAREAKAKIKTKAKTAKPGVGRTGARSRKTPSKRRQSAVAMA